MKQILVVITEEHNHHVEVYNIPNKDAAREFIKTKYVELIQTVDHCDYDNTCISKKFDFAQVSSYSNVYRIAMCSNVTEILKHKQKKK